MITEIENKQTEANISLNVKNATCTHCGITISDRDNAIYTNKGDTFCCWGCETVYKILKKGGVSLINKPSTSLPEYDFLDTESFLKDYSVIINNKKTMRFFIEGIQCNRLSMDH